MYEPPEQLEEAVSKLIRTYGLSPQVGHLQCGLGCRFMPWHGVVRAGRWSDRMGRRSLLCMHTWYAQCLKVIGDLEHKMQIIMLIFSVIFNGLSLCLACAHGPLALGSASSINAVVAIFLVGVVIQRWSRTHPHITHFTAPSALTTSVVHACMHAGAPAAW